MRNLKFPLFSRGLGVVALLCLAVGARADDVTYMSQAEGANAALQLEGPHLSTSDKSSFEQTIADLKTKATELDQLKSQIDAKTQDVNAAQTDYDTANSAATPLRQQADQASQDGKSRVEQIVQSVNGICTQMGGSVNGEECLFTCPENQQQECSQKVAAFNSQIAQLKSQIESIVQGIQEAEQKAQAAEAEANQKQQAVQAAQSAVDDLNKQLQPKADAFQQELQTFTDDLKKAEKPISLKLGPAYHQAQQVLGHMTENEVTCYDRTCHDLGANSDGTLVVPPVPSSPTSVPADKVNQLQTEMQNLTTQYNDIHDKLRQAEANHDPGVGDLIKKLSSIQGQVEMQAYKMKTYHIDMSQVAAPKK